MHVEDLLDLLQASLEYNMQYLALLVMRSEYPAIQEELAEFTDNAYETIGVYDDD